MKNPFRDFKLNLTDIDSLSFTIMKCNPLFSIAYDIQ